MKIYDLRKKDGTPIQPDIYDKYVQDNNGLLPDILYEIGLIKNSITRDGVSHIRALGILDGFDSTRYKYDWVNIKGNTIPKNSIIRHDDMWYISRENRPISNKPIMKSSYFFHINRTDNPICLFRDNMGSITSKYGYTWNDLSSMLRNNDYTKYIKNNDYIELVIDGYLFTMRFNIDIYYDYSYGAPYSNSVGALNRNIPHHIDMISDEVVPTSDTQYLDLGIIDVKSVPTICTPGNNGLNLYQSVSVKMWNKYYHKFSQDLRNRIIPKYCTIGDRYSTNITNHIERDDVIPIGHLWQPREAEIIGEGFLSNPRFDASLCIQYPSFKYTGTRRFTAKQVGDTSSTVQGGRYITWSMRGDGSETIFVNEYGEIMYNSSAQKSVSNLLCFRIV